jgi:RNA polymerase sigma factor FliA
MTANPATARSSNDDAVALWHEYRRSGDARIRDRLVLTYAPLVKQIAHKKVRELPAHVQIEDLIACGLEALIRALDRFDPSKGGLQQFLWTRIAGAMIDELRRHDWAPRSVRRWERDIRKARREFTTIHGHEPSEDQLAASLGITPDQLTAHKHNIISSDITSLNSLVMGDQSTPTERIDTLIADTPETDPAAASLATDTKARFRSAFSRLPRREQEIAVLLYAKDLNQREVGDILGISESRVCQIHKQLKTQLKSQLIDTETLAQAA